MLENPQVGLTELLVASDVKIHWPISYDSTCDLCLQTKPQHHPLTRELHPLPILDAHWETISVDFVVELPESTGYDTVMTIVNTVSKQVQFALTHTTITTEGAAHLFLHYVWKLHGLPLQVVLDRGPQFVAAFTKELYQLVGIKLALSTAWHP
jgi:hypothetical protein